jgi:DNA-binding MarR family transcriptional regulator
MSDESPERQAARLLQLSKEVTRIAASLAQLSVGLASPLRQNYAPTNSNQSDLSAETVRWLIGARRNRARFLSSELLADPAWDMLLDLLHAELANRPVSVSSVCLASGVPQTTGLRWLKTLEQRGLVVRKLDGRDGRRILIELSPDTSKAMRGYIRENVESRRAAER